MRPLVVTTVDRLDLVLGLMGAQVSAHGPGLAGVLLCPSGHRHSTAGRARCGRRFWGVVLFRSCCRAGAARWEGAGAGEGEKDGRLGSGS